MNPDSDSAGKRRLPEGVYRRVGHSGSVAYQARWRDASGRLHAATFDTAKDAAAYRSDQLRERRTGGTGDPTGGRRPLGPWWQTWMAGRVVRPTSRARDDGLGRHHILPAFGDWRLADIRAVDVKAFRQKLLDNGLSPATAGKCLHLLSACLDEAVAEQLIAANPATRVRRPQIPDNEARFLTLAELSELEAAIDPYWRLVVALGVDTGLRLGELAALQVDDVDFLRHVVTVSATMVEPPKAVSGSSQSLIRQTPKTNAGRRTVPTLTGDVAEQLARMVEMRGLTSSDLLFTGPNGGAMRPKTWRRRVWNPAVKSAQLSDPHPTPHSLRHTAVSRWIATGFPTAQIAKFAGHRSDHFLQKTYGYLLEVDTTQMRAEMQEMRRVAESDRQRRLNEQDTGEVVSIRTRQSY